MIDIHVERESLLLKIGREIDIRRKKSYFLNVSLGVKGGTAYGNWKNIHKEKGFVHNTHLKIFFKTVTLYSFCKLFVNWEFFYKW